ncbi:hypothetical protein EDC94DRAFT_527166 [Helicostylum pulchrum]|nr:hypothetical protein EDC94DRAFT_527166 [Helicostylum pulchrum]
MIKPVNKNPKPASNEIKSSLRNTEFNSSLSIVQREDNFVTFMPVNSTVRTKKPTVPKKSKMKDSIFVTELPQNSYKKKRSQLSSGDENSDDDMLLDEQFPASKLKNMTPKERRQLRNKISARNFRVRRKEYITQLEEKVEEHEQTIDGLQQENSKLRLANDELMKQLLNQPLTPPSSDNVLSSSGSEGNYSPDTGPVSTMFQFQFNDLYDLNLFDQSQPQETTTADTSNLFYLNHAVMPDWDIHQVLGEKGKPMFPEIDQRQAARDLIHDYPLLAPALMSIVVRHTLSLEYVTSIAKEFSASLGPEFAEKPSEEKLQKMETLKIKGATDSKDLCKEEDSLSDAEFIRLVMKNYFPSYLLLRARGISHDETIERFKHCYRESPTCFKKHKDAMLKKKNDESQQASKSSKPSKLSTLHTYCKVASTLLKHPTRMAHVNQVLKKEITFTHNRHTSRIENQYASMMGPFKNLRIANSSR